MHLTNEESERLARVARFARPLGRYKGTGMPFGEVKCGQDPETGVRRVPYTEYPAVFGEFRNQLIADGWLDGPYSQDEGLRYMHDRGLLGRADPPTIQRLLLFCDRGERFSDGFWRHAVESGFVTDILDRITALLQGDRG